MRKYFSSKRIITLGGLFILSIAVTACLKEEIPSEARLNPSALNSGKALEAAVAGMYRQFNQANQWGFNWIRAYGGDDLTAHSGWNKQGYRDADQMALSSLTPSLELAYIPYYYTIREANNIITNRAYITEKTADINYLLGEAYFLRAISYFHLTRTFGRVPLITTTSIAENSDLPRAEIIEIYRQIESDLLEAERLLPDKYPQVASAVRPNNGSARAFLAKVYIHWAGWPLKDNSKYALAAVSAKKVIDKAIVHGFALVPDMKTLWSTRDENRFNKETVFGVAHNSNLSTSYSNRHSGRVGYPRSVQGWSEVFPEYTYFEEFPDGPRKKATFRTEVVFGGITYNWQDIKDNSEGKNEVHPLYLKATGFQDEIATNNSTTNVTTYLMRYADLLLYYAEAVGRSGGNDADAWEALNKVRRRAYGYPIDTRGSLVDITSGNLAELAYIERKWELGGEFIRWDDLMRLERVQEALKQRSPKEPVGPITGNTGTANYFAPLPLSELTKAPNLTE